MIVSRLLFFYGKRTSHTQLEDTHCAFSLTGAGTCLCLEKIVLKYEEICRKSNTCAISSSKTEYVQEKVNSFSSKDYCINF